MRSIACIGDWGYDTIPKFAKEALIHIDDIFLLGDNFYPDGVDSENDEQWTTKLKNFFPMGKKKHVVLGNHDYLGNVHAQLLYTFAPDYFSWHLPHYFHDEKDFENDAHFFFLDTALLSLQYTTNLLRACNIQNERLQKYFFLVEQFADQQKTWLIDQLSRSKLKWKILVGHYPVVSGGKHGISTELFEFIHFICKKFHIDYYISGHEHNVQFLQKFNTNFIISGGLQHNYNVMSIPETVFCTEDPSFVQLEVQKKNICTYLISDKGKQLLFFHSK